MGVVPFGVRYSCAGISAPLALAHAVSSRSLIHMPAEREGVLARLESQLPHSRQNVGSGAHGKHHCVQPLARHARGADNRNGLLLEPDDCRPPCTAVGTPMIAAQWAARPEVNGDAKADMTFCRADGLPDGRLGQHRTRVGDPLRTGRVIAACTWLTAQTAAGQTDVSRHNSHAVVGYWRQGSPNLICALWRQVYRGSQRQLARWRRGPYRKDGQCMRLGLPSSTNTPKPGPVRPWAKRRPCRDPQSPIATSSRFAISVATHV